MADARYDFASVDAIDAESIGEPGKRTFRVRVLEGDQSAALWVEKQLLAALGESLPRLLDQLSTSDQHSDVEAEAITLFPDDPTVEFKVGRMALGYAASEDRVVLVAHDVEDGRRGRRSAADFFLPLHPPAGAHAERGLLRGRRRRPPHLPPVPTPHGHRRPHVPALQRPPESPPARGR